MKKIYVKPVVDATALAVSSVLAGSELVINPDKSVTEAYSKVMDIWDDEEEEE